MKWFPFFIVMGIYFGLELLKEIGGIIRGICRTWRPLLVMKEYISDSWNVVDISMVVIFAMMCQYYVALKRHSDAVKALDTPVCAEANVELCGDEFLKAYALETGAPLMAHFSGIDAAAVSIAGSWCFMAE